MDSLETLGVGHHLLRFEGVAPGLPLLEANAWRDRRGFGRPRLPRGRTRREAAAVEGWARGVFRVPSTDQQLVHTWLDGERLLYLTWKRAILRLECTISEMGNEKKEPAVGGLVVCRRLELPVGRAAVARAAATAGTRTGPSWSEAPAFSDDVLRACCLYEDTRALYWPPLDRAISEWFEAKSKDTPSHLLVALDQATMGNWALAAKLVRDGDAAQMQQQAAAG